MKRQAAALAAIVLFSAGLAAQGPVPKELAGFQGTWDIVTVNGEPLATSGTTGEITVTGNKYEVKINGAVNERGTITVDPAKTPMTIDFNIIEGPEASSGTLQLGIFELTGDTIRFHLATPGLTPRPVNFEPIPQHDIIIVKKRAAL